MAQASEAPIPIASQLIFNFIKGVKVRKSNIVAKRRWPGRLTSRPKDSFGEERLTHVESRRTNFAG